MGQPIGAQIIDGTSERVIRITEVYGRFVLRSIRVDRVAMAKAVSVVVTNDRLPLLEAMQLQLHGILDNSFATAPIRATNTNLVWNKIDQPSPIGHVRVRHYTFPHGSVPPTGSVADAAVATSGSSERETIVPNGRTLPKERRRSGMDAGLCGHALDGCCGPSVCVRDRAQVFGSVFDYVAVVVTLKIHWHFAVGTWHELPFLAEADGMPIVMREEMAFDVD
jgi:hypothetical protein